MGLVPCDLELSCRRAPQREIVLLFLAHTGRASVGEISASTGVRPARVVAIMEGAPREYSRRLALVPQGAATRRERDARRYRITPLGVVAAHEAALRLGLA